MAIDDDDDDDNNGDYDGDVQSKLRSADFSRFRFFAYIDYCHEMM